MLRWLILASFVSYVQCACSNTPEGGTLEISCLEYGTCHNGNIVHHTCPVGMAYHTVKKICAPKSTVPIPCSLDRDCSNVKDGHYADHETNCTSYYTCFNNGVYYGHNFCSPGTVYDEKMQLCNWPQNVAQPCGTAPVVGK